MTTIEETKSCITELDPGVEPNGVHVNGKKVEADEGLAKEQGAPHDAVANLRRARGEAVRELEQVEKRAAELRAELGLDKAPVAVSLRVTGLPSVPGPVRPTRAARTQQAAAPTKSRPAKPSKPKKSGRLPRRSEEDIQALVGKVVELVKASGPLRAEVIREKLGVQAKELPRVFKMGLSQKVLRASGEKRATEYSLPKTRAR